MEQIRILKTGRELACNGGSCRGILALGDFCTDLALQGPYCQDLGSIFSLYGPHRELKHRRF